VNRTSELSKNPCDWLGKVLILEMGTKRGSSRVSVLFERLRKMPMKVKIFCGALLAVCALVALKFTFRSHYYYFIASEAIHVAGIIALVYKLFALKTCSGTFPFPSLIHHITLFMNSHIPNFNSQFLATDFNSKILGKGLAGFDLLFS